LHFGAEVLELSADVYDEMKYDGTAHDVADLVTIILQGLDNPI
jgi:hypothetical protein